MNEPREPTLFDLPIAPDPEPESVLRARNSDPETSHASMAAFDPERLARSADFVADLHRRYGALADYELKQHFAREWPEKCCDHLYRQARSAARDRGLIRDSGQRKRNPTTKRLQVMWEFVANGTPPVIRHCPTCGHVLREDGRQEALPR